MPPTFLSHGGPRQAEGASDWIRRRLLKALWFDRTGWAIFSKRLERGTFELPVVQPGTREIAVDPGQLAMILEGIELSARRRRRYRPEHRI